MESVSSRTLRSQKTKEVYCQSLWNRAGLDAVYFTVCWILR
jgi:hypothetical protein